MAPIKPRKNRFLLFLLKGMKKIMFAIKLSRRYGLITFKLRTKLSLDAQSKSTSVERYKVVNAKNGTSNPTKTPIYTLSILCIDIPAV